MSIKKAIGVSVGLLALSGIVIYFAYLTFQNWDAENWGRFVLGIFATAGSFIVLVVCVKRLFTSKDSDED